MSKAMFEIEILCDPTGFIEAKTKHSKKPETMFKMIEKVSYALYFELFARKKRDKIKKLNSEKIKLR